mgnify:CR=1 FL=1
MPTVQNFAPVDTIADGYTVNTLLLEELEAIRLKDLEGLEQEDCAVRMEVSRPTFQRILLSAREKVADCLINGKAINIGGGNYTRNICPVRCLDCGTVRSESYENMEAVRVGSYKCTECGSVNVVCGTSVSSGFCQGQCRRRGAGRGRGRGRGQGCSQ